MSKIHEDYATNELRALRKDVPDAIVLEFSSEIISLVNKVQSSGSSGMTLPLYAATVAKVVEDLCLSKPITPIHDDPDQWYLPDASFEAFAIDNVTDAEVAELQSDLDSYKPEMQHNRLSSLFKDYKGICRYIDAIVWVGEYEGDQFTGTVEGISSSQIVKFPFVPKTFYIDVVEGEDGKYQIKDYKDLKPVFEYYKKPE